MRRVPPGGTSACARSTRATVLVVDDDPKIRELVRLYLARDGHRTLEAADGPRALQIARTRRCDLVLLDVMLPGLDGLEVCRQLPSGRGEMTARRRDPVEGEGGVKARALHDREARNPGGASPIGSCSPMTSSGSRTWPRSARSFQDPDEVRRQAAWRPRLPVCGSSSTSPSSRILARTNRIVWSLIPGRARRMSRIRTRGAA